MSVFQDARVLIFVADYAGVDAGQKINAIGAAFNLTGLQAQTGLIPPQHVVVIIDVPTKYVGTDFAVSIELRRDDLNQAVTVPGPAGKAEAMRIQQIVRPERPQVPAGAHFPSDLYARIQFALAFPTGLQLQSGVTYRWRVEIEGQTRPGWDAVFHVLAPAPGPVFGGPSAPPDPEMPRFNEGDKPGDRPEDEQG
jgi:hypothetical protein